MTSREGKNDLSITYISVRNTFRKRTVSSHVMARSTNCAIHCEGRRGTAPCRSAQMGVVMQLVSLWDQSRLTPFRFIDNMIDSMSQSMGILSLILAGWHSEKRLHRPKEARLSSTLTGNVAAVSTQLPHTHILRLSMLKLKSAQSRQP